jgi:hypothetical protein
LQSIFAGDNRVIEKSLANEYHCLTQFYKHINHVSPFYSCKLKRLLISLCKLDPICFVILIFSYLDRLIHEKGGKSISKIDGNNELLGSAIIEFFIEDRIC